MSIQQVRWSAEVADPVTGEVTILQADSETQLDVLVEALLAGQYPIPVQQGAGSAENVAAVREVLKLITRLLGASTRLVEVTNSDLHMRRIVISVSASPRVGQLGVLAELEQRLQQVLGGSWQACWQQIEPGARTLLITPSQ